MSLSTPQTMTIDTIATTLNRIEENKNSSIYSSDDGNVKLTVSHQVSKNRSRRMARLDRRVIAADPLSAENKYQSTGIYIVIDEPDFGFTDAQLTGYVNALKTWLADAITGAILASRH